LLQEQFHWKSMIDDVTSICNLCLHCIPTRGGKRIPRPFGEACHGTRPNQVLHFDFMYIMPRVKGSYHEFEWVLVIVDDLSGLVHLTPAVTPDTETTVDALMEWRSKFGTSEVYVSDQASYFLSEVMRSFAKKAGVEQQYWTTAYIH
ncbi:hypothetical protein B5P41_33830, partial [Bacillus sp. SRB_28]